ncbi:MAG: hypothetical protein J0I84_08915 [Terrimonas sp.]|nr:hypothetical protein [Terrimonas sp.]
MLVDVSLSMATSMENKSGVNINRLQSFENTLESMIKKVAQYKDVDFQNRITIKLFAYGFGFGNLFSDFLGLKTENVKDLLETDHSQTSTISLIKLADEWLNYKKHLESLVFRWKSVQC